MQDAERPHPAREDLGVDVLALLADAVVKRVEALLSERLDGLAPSADADVAADRWLKASEVAERVGACERTVYRALRSGALSGERLGTRWRIRPAAVDAWLAEPSDTPAAKPLPRARAEPSPPGQPRNTSFTARARALEAGRAAAPKPTTNGRLGARREEQL